MLGGKPKKVLFGVRGVALVYGAGPLFPDVTGLLASIGLCANFWVLSRGGGYVVVSCRTQGALLLVSFPLVGAACGFLVGVARGLLCCSRVAVGSLRGISLLGVNPGLLSR